MARRYRRVVVIGPPGSGKSTLARRLSLALHLDLVELDVFLWERDWKQAAPDVFRTRTDEATRGAAWVVAGAYPHVRDIVWPRAEAIVWLDYSLPLVVGRLTARLLRRSITREVLWNGNRESFWPHLRLWSERSVLRLLLNNYWRDKREYLTLLALPEHAHIDSIRLRAPREADRWLRGAGG